MRKIYKKVIRLIQSKLEDCKKSLLGPGHYTAFCLSSDLSLSNTNYELHLHHDIAQLTKLGLRILIVPCQSNIEFEIQGENQACFCKMKEEQRISHCIKAIEPLKNHDESSFYHLLSFVKICCQSSNVDFKTNIAK